jgi:hypothetical protein
MEGCRDGGMYDWMDGWIVPFSLMCKQRAPENQIFMFCSDHFTARQAVTYPRGASADGLGNMTCVEYNGPDGEAANFKSPAMPLNPSVGFSHVKGSLVRGLEPI